MDTIQITEGIKKVNTEFDFIEILEALKESMAKERMTHLVEQVFCSGDYGIAIMALDDMEYEAEQLADKITRLKAKLSK